MQCIIMAAGKGKRMRPLTLATPKPLLPVAGKPIVEWTIERLPDSVDEIIFVVNWLKEQCIERFQNGVAGRRVKFVVQDETMPQGTGGAILAAREGLHDRFLVLNGDDVYSAADLKALISVDGPAIAAKPSTVSGRFGVLEADERGNLAGLKEAGDHPSGSLINVGAYFLDQRIFDVPLVPIAGGEFGLPHAVANAAATYPVRIVWFNEWIPFGAPPDLDAGAKILGGAL